MNNFIVAIREGKAIAIEEANGNYRASSGVEIERALNEMSFIPLTAEVRIADKWYPLKARYERVAPSVLDVLFIGKKKRRVGNL